MSNTTEDQIVAHLRKLLNERDEQSRKRIADLERDLAHSRVMERQLAAELAHLRSELANQLLAIEIATTAAAQGIDVSTNDSGGKTETMVQAEPTEVREYVVTGTHCDLHVDCEAADAKRMEKDGTEAEHVCRRDFVMKV
jgi:hypothetical protein